MPIFKLVLPPADPKANVVERYITFTVGGGSPIEESLAGDATDCGEHAGTYGDSVVGALVDKDQAGNASEPSAFDLVLLDTMAPPMPGQVGIVIVSE